MIHPWSKLEYKTEDPPTNVENLKSWSIVIVIYSWIETEFENSLRKYTYIEHHNKKITAISSCTQFSDTGFMNSQHLDKHHVIYKEKWYTLWWLFTQGSCIFAGYFCLAPGTLCLWGSRSFSSSQLVLLETWAVSSTKEHIQFWYAYTSIFLQLDDRGMRIPLPAERVQLSIECDSALFLSSLYEQ